MKREAAARAIMQRHEEMRQQRELIREASKKYAPKFRDEIRRKAERDTTAVPEE